MMMGSGEHFQLFEPALMNPRNYAQETELTDDCLKQIFSRASAFTPDREWHPDKHRHSNNIKTRPVKHKVMKKKNWSMQL